MHEELKELTLRDYYEVIKKRKWIVFWFTFISTFIALILSFFVLKPIYEVQVNLMMRQPQSFSSQFGGLASLVGVSLGGKELNQSQDVLDLLSLDALAERVIRNLQLDKKIEGWRTWKELIETVKRKKESPKTTRTNLIRITFSDKDPQLAKDIAHSYLEALRYYSYQLTYTQAAKKLDYINAQLPIAEKDYNEIAKKLSRYSRLLSAPQSTPTTNLGGLMQSSGQILPQAKSIDFDRMQNDYEMQKNIYISLKKEYEMTRLEEAKNLEPYVVVDEPRLPEKPVKPLKKLNTIIGFMLGLSSGIFIAFFLEYWESTGKEAAR